MKGSLAFAAGMALAATLALAGCGGGAAPSAPTPTSVPPTKAAAPTKAPAAAPTKVAESTKAPAAAAQPTAPPAKKVAFPEPGKPITIVSGFSAGGVSDLSVRLVASQLEKTVGTPVQVLIKTGASGQVAMTEVARARPDGYTLGLAVFAPFLTTYLDPSRKPTYGRQDFAPVAHYASSAIALVVKADGPYKTLKDLVDAARAAPEKIKVGTSGILSNNHLTPLGLQQAAGVRFAYVHFTGAAETTAAVLGEHIDAGSVGLPESLGHYKSGTMRVLGTTEKGQNKFLPEVKSLEEQGYKVYITSSFGLAAPAGTPREVLDALTGAVKRAVESEEYRNRAKEVGQIPDYMDTAQYESYWTRSENEVRPLIELSNRG